MPVISLHVYIYALPASGALKIYISARIHVPVIYCTYTYALPIVYIRTYTCALISARIHVHVMWCVYLTVCYLHECILVMYVLEHCKYAGLRSRWWFCHNDEIETRPSSFPPPLHISPWDGWFFFTHEWLLQILPLDEGICLMCKSFVKGQYLRWLQLSRLVFACRKASSIFANCQYLPQSFEVISLPQKSNPNQFSQKSQIQINLVRNY